MIICNILYFTPFTQKWMRCVSSLLPTCLQVTRRPLSSSAIRSTGRLYHAKAKQDTTGGYSNLPVSGRPRADDMGQSILRLVTSDRNVSIAKIAILTNVSRSSIGRALKRLIDQSRSVQRMLKKLG